MIVISPMQSNSLPIGDIPTQVFRSAEPYRNEVVLIDAESNHQFTIDDIINQSTKLAAGLARCGYGGRVISVFDNTNLQCVYVYYASMMAGGAYQSLGTSISAKSLRDRIILTQTPAIFTSRLHLARLKDATRGLGVRIYIFDPECTPNVAVSAVDICCGSDGQGSCCCAPISHLLIDDPTFVPVRITSKADAMAKPAYLTYPTIHGTSPQQPLMLSHYSLLSSQQLTRPPRLLDSANRTVVSAVPFSDAHGINIIAHFPMLSGSRVVQMSSHGSGSCLGTLEKWDAGAFLATYSILAEIDKKAVRIGDRIAIGAQSFDVSSLNVIFMHELRATQAFKERISALFQARLVELYGYIETGLIAGVITEHPRIDGSVGVLCPNVSAHVVLNGKEMEDGQYGEILVSTPRLASNVCSDSKNAGYFCTGDYGMVTADGVVVIKARMSDLIYMSNGEVAVPADIESVVAAHPDVVDCAAFAVPVKDAEGSHIPHVAVVPAAKASLNMDEILESLAIRYPGITGFFTDCIPRNDKGEPKRAHLRDLACKQEARS
ncbi:hypothetical protein BX070DRAFT_232668 [Coemansia spiralis]|nr:hypothetical protein BX070DRAFT_232668 [Coemansia spiralis]